MSKGGGLSTILVAAALGAVTGGIGLAAAGAFSLAGVAVYAGVGAALAGIQLALTPSQKRSKQQISDKFGSTSQRNIAVPVIFGRARIASQFLMLPPGKGQSIYMGTKLKDNQGRVYLVHFLVSWGEGPLPAHGIGNFQIAGKTTRNYWIEIKDKKVDPQWEDGTDIEHRNATFFFDTNRGLSGDQILNMVLDKVYATADLENVLQPGSSPKPNGFSIEDNTGTRVLADTRMPIVPFRRTVTSACQIYTGNDVQLMDITADRLGQILTLSDSGVNSGVNSGDVVGSVFGYDSTDEVFYWTLTSSTGTTGPFGLVTLNRLHATGRNHTRPPIQITSNVLRAWYYGKSDIVVMQDPDHRQQFWLGNLNADRNDESWHAVTPHTGQAPGGYDNPILAEHLDDLNARLHTIHDDGTVRYIMRWNVLTGRVERMDTDLASTGFRGMAYSSDLDAYIVADTTTLICVAAQTGETFLSTTSVNLVGLKGLFATGNMVGTVNASGFSYWDTSDPSKTYGPYGNSATDLNKGHFGNIDGAVQNTRTGQVTMTKPNSGTVAWINFIPSCLENIEDVSAMGSKAEGEFQKFWNGYAEVITGSTHSWNTGAVSEPYFRKVNPPASQYTRTSGNISLIVSPTDEKLTFGQSSSLDDLLVMVKTNQAVTDNWNGTSVRPTVTFTIPDDAIIIANTVGSFMSAADSAYNATCPKIFTDGDHTVNFPDGSHDPSVVDDYSAFVSAGFNVKFFNEGIDVSDLDDGGFIDDGMFTCRLYHIVCGNGAAKVLDMGFITSAVPESDPDTVTGAIRDWSTRTYNAWNVVRLEGNSSLAASMYASIVNRPELNTGRWGAGLDASYVNLPSFEGLHARCVAPWMFANKPKVVLLSGSESEITSVPMGAPLKVTDTSGSDSDSASSGSGSADTNLSEIRQTYRMAERFKFDYLLDSQTTVSELMTSQMLAACNGYRFMSNGQLHVGIQLPGMFAAWHFQDDHIEDNTIAVSETNGAGIINRVRVEFREVRDESRANLSTADREFDQLKFGRVGEQSLSLPGIARQTQADLIANQVVDQAIASRRGVQWTTNFLGYAFEPGDVVEVSGRNTGLDRTRCRIVKIDERGKKTISFSATEFKPILSTLASQLPGEVPVGTLETTIGSQEIAGQCEEQTCGTGSGVKYFNGGASYSPGKYDIFYVTNCARIFPQNRPGGYIVQGWDVVTRKADGTIVTLIPAPAVPNPPSGWLTESEAVTANTGQSAEIHLDTAGPIGLRLRHVPQYTNFGRFGPAPTYELCVGQEVVFGSVSECVCAESDAWIIGKTYAVVSYTIAVTSWDTSGVPGFTVHATNVRLFWNGSKFTGYVNNYPVEAAYVSNRWTVTVHTTINYSGNQVPVSGFVRSPANACKCVSLQSGTLNPTPGVVGQVDGSGTFGNGHGTGNASIKVCQPQITTVPPPTSTPTSVPPSSVPPTSYSAGVPSYSANECIFYAWYYCHSTGVVAKTPVRFTCPEEYPQDCNENITDWTSCYETINGEYTSNCPVSGTVQCCEVILPAHCPAPAAPPPPT